MNKSASVAKLLVVNANWVGISFMWNALHPIVLPALLAPLVPEDSKNTYLGLLTFAGLLIAMLLQPISGALSDRWVSRLGRRRPLMILGTVFDCVFLGILGWVGGIAWLFIGYIGLQISSNIAQGPLQGLLRDRVPIRQLGIASSIKVFVDLGSLVAASVVAGRLINTGRTAGSNIMLVVAALLIASAAVTIVFTDEEPTRGPDRVLVRPQLEAPMTLLSRTGYWWLIAERAAFLLGVYGLQAFGQYYIQDALRVPDAPRAAGNLLAIIGMATIALVLAAGWLSDRFGPKRLLHAASILTATGMLLMVLIVDLRGLYAVGVIVGCGIGLFLTSNWALANRIAPESEAGKFLGLTNLATAGAAALSRLEGPALDALNAARPSQWLGYKGMFVFGAFCILQSAWFLGRVKSPPQPGG